jgi:predicted small secreted protein
MRTITTLALLASAMLLAACNTVHGAGEDVRSIGRVFSHDPNGDNQRSR